MLRDFLQCLKKSNFQKIFSINEIKKYKKRLNKYNCFAMSCCKEAFVKALGLQLTNGMKFKEIEITNTNEGFKIKLKKIRLRL